MVANASTLKAKHHPHEHRHASLEHTDGTVFVSKDDWLSVRAAFLTHFEVFWL